MLQSKLVFKTQKQAPADADSVNAKLLSRGAFVQQQMAGVYTYLPLGLRVLTKIQKVIREEMEYLGANEILMPALTQKENYDTTGRSNLDILFHTQGHNQAEYILNQSHEEVVTPLAQKHTFSYRDLPYAVFQIQNKFRNEARAKSGLLRGREFNMKDLYSFHVSSDDLDSYYESVKKAYFKIYDRLGLGQSTVLVFASGGSFTKYSHEFQTLCDVGEDTVYLCERCHVAVNKEIIHEQNTCPECGNAELIEKRGIEVGNIFKLGTRFSNAFGFTYKDENNAKHLVEMGCYGIGPSRLMGTVVEVFHDDKGIVWPASIAPFTVHLVGLDLDNVDVAKKAKIIYESFLNKGVETLFDDRVGLTAGEKLGDADLIGIPWRVIVSKRTQGEAEVKKRSEKESRVMRPADAIALSIRT